MGHEFIGVVEDIGADVSTLKPGDIVIAPFAWSDNTCEFCRDGCSTSCVHGGFWDGSPVGGGQAEAAACRWPTAPWSSSPVARTPR